MKKRLLQIGCFLLALVVLFVSVGWDVCFHYCTSSHTMTSHIGMGLPMHAQCLGHAQCGEESHEHHPTATHFDAKGCCDDFDSKIQFTDKYIFTPKKLQNLHYQPFVFLHFAVFDLSMKAKQVFGWFAMQKIPLLPFGKLRLVFFSQLKLNPLVF